MRQGGSLIAIERPAGAFDAAGRQLTQLYGDTLVWLHDHLLQILIGVGAAALIVIALHG